jgi:hypothetical protein
MIYALYAGKILRGLCGMSEFKMPKNIIVPTARVEKAGEEVMSVAFDLGLETGDIPIAIVFENHKGKTYTRKLLKGDEALELHRLLAE